MQLDIKPDLNELLAAELQAALTDESLAKLKKKMQDALAGIEDEIEYNLKDQLAGSLAWHVQQHADSAIKSLLVGDENLMRGYLGCVRDGWNGREFETPVIRGEIHESSAQAFRRRIVDVHADLLKNERILDLESQVSSLARQVAALEGRIEQMHRQRL